MSIDQFLPAAQSIATWLAPFLPYLIKGAKLAGEEWFKELGEKGGEEAVKQATGLWDSLKNSSKNNKRVEGTAFILSEDPGNEDIQKQFRNAITEVLQKNPDLVQELTSFIKTAPTININRRSSVFSSGKGNITVGRDQGISGEDLNELVKTLLKYFPKSYLQNPDELDKTLNDLRHYHKQLHEYKELHNKINQILVAFDPFKLEMKRLNSLGNVPELERLQTNWHPVEIRVKDLLDWAKNIDIGKRFRILEDGGKEGESWAVGYSEVRDQINRLGLSTNSIENIDRLNKKEIYSFQRAKNKVLWLQKLEKCMSEFNDITLFEMDKADEQLRQTAQELLNISKSALSNF